MCGYADGTVSTLKVVAVPIIYEKYEWSVGDSSREEFATAAVRTPSVVTKEKARLRRAEPGQQLAVVSCYLLRVAMS